MRKTILFLLVAGCSLHLAAASYTFTDLGSLGGGGSQGAALNDSGQATGYAITAAFAPRAFLYSAGTMTNLGTFGGTSQGVGINASGQVVGFSYLANNSTYNAFLYSGGVTNLGAGINSTATGINDSSEIVGRANGQTFTYQNGAFTYYDANNFATPTAINNSGEIAGQTRLGGTFHPGAIINGQITDLGILPGGTYGAANALNDSGEVVGWSGTNGISQQHAFIYLNGVMTDLGTLGGTTSNAYGINNAGQVVGGAAIANGQTHPFLYDGQNMIDLTSIITAGGFSQVSLNDINNLGQILGTGTNIATGNIDAFIMTPTSSSQSGSVPEPATLMLFGAGLVGIARRLRRRRHAV